MDNPKAEKVAVVDEVRTRFEEADAVIVTEYRGLKVKDLSVLRRSLAPLGGEYRVYKNTLVRIAAGDAGDNFVGLLSGPTALTFVKGDAAAVTKALRDFSRTNPLLLVKGGLLGRSVLGPQATLALADLPSREVLLARLAGGLAAPMQAFAGLLSALPRNFAYGLAALRDKKVASGDLGGPSASADTAAPTGTAPVAVEDEPGPAAAAAPTTGDEPGPAAPTAADEPDAAPTAAADQGAAAPTTEVAESAAPATEAAEESVAPKQAEPNAAEPAEGSEAAAPAEGAEHAEDPDGTDGSTGAGPVSSDA